MCVKFPLRDLNPSLFPLYTSQALNTCVVTIIKGMRWFFFFFPFLILETINENLDPKLII